MSNTPQKDDNENEEFANQSSLCSSCMFGIRQVLVDFDTAVPEKELIFLCHSRAIRGNLPGPSVITVLITECEPYEPTFQVVKSS